MPCASCTLACLAGRILARKPRCDACDCHLGVRTGQSRPSKYHACTCGQSRTAICGVTKAPLWAIPVQCPSTPKQQVFNHTANVHPSATMTGAHIRSPRTLHVSRSGLRVDNGCRSRAFSVTSSYLACILPTIFPGLLQCLKRSRTWSTL